MKKFLTLLCVLALLVSISPMPVRAADDGIQTEVTSAWLRTVEGKEGIFFSANFTLTQDAINDMARYGLAVTTVNTTDDDYWAKNMDDTVLRSTYTQDTNPLTASKTKNVKSTSLVNIIEVNNDRLTNKNNAETIVYIRPYVEKKDGSFVFGETVSTSMMAILRAVAKTENYYDTLSSTQKKGLLGMYERFSCMDGWGLTNLKNHYDAGGYVDANGKICDADSAEKSLVLEYRRDKVVAAMEAQHNVLWTVEEDVTVHFNGIDTSKTDGIFTMPDVSEEYVTTYYKDRVYKGLPYTRGGNSSFALEAFATNQDPNTDGYYVLPGNPALFSGSSYSSDSDITQWNKARIGGDCWDIVHWAWSGISGSVKADQTKRVNHMYDTNLVTIGWDEILVEAIEQNKFTPSSNNSPLTTDNIINWYLFNSNNEWKSISGQDIIGTITYPYNGETIDVEIDATVDGTRLVHYLTRTVTNAEYDTVNQKWVPTEYDNQALYKTYAQLEPGDIVNRFRNTMGHSLMIMSVHVEYTDDTKTIIDGEKSKVTYLEQTHGHEETQDKTETQVINGKETTVYVLDYPEREKTFKEMAETDNYLGVRCKELNDPTETPGKNIAVDSATSKITINNLFTGTLKGSYRVTKITLEIWQGNELMSSTACLANGDTSLVNTIDLTRFYSDQTTGFENSPGVLAGNPLPLTLEADGTVTKADTSILSQGEYQYIMKYTFANGFENTFRSGFFLVNATGNVTAA